MNEENKEFCCPFGMMKCGEDCPLLVYETDPDGLSTGNASCSIAVISSSLSAVDDTLSNIEDSLDGIATSLSRIADALTGSKDFGYDITR